MKIGHRKAELLCQTERSTKLELVGSRTFSDASKRQVIPPGVLAHLSPDDVKSEPLDFAYDVVSVLHRAVDTSVSHQRASARIEGRSGLSGSRRPAHGADDENRPRLENAEGFSETGRAIVSDETMETSAVHDNIKSTPTKWQRAYVAGLEPALEVCADEGFAGPGTASAETSIPSTTQSTSIIFRTQSGPWAPTGLRRR